MALRNSLVLAVLGFALLGNSISSANPELLPDFGWIEEVEFDDAEVNTTAAKYATREVIDKHTTFDWMAKAFSFVDYSTLSGLETPDVMKQVCEHTAFPLRVLSEDDQAKIKERAGGAEIRCAGVVSLPLRLDDAVNALKELGAENKVIVAAVAAGFPTGQYPLHTRLAEIRYALAHGATEVDCAIDRTLVLRGRWRQLYNELVQMRRTVGDKIFKVILSCSQFPTMTDVYRASIVAMYAGADYIKTSTGSEALFANLDHTYVIALAIRDFYNLTGIRVGIKHSGGIDTVDRIISTMVMAKDVLGEEYLTPKLFRVGTGAYPWEKLVFNYAEGLRALVN